MLDVHLERPPVVICQCLLPCFMPILDADGSLAETSGCLRPAGHADDDGHGGHSLDGSPTTTYRDPPSSAGPRLVLRAEHPGGVLRGTCWRCGAEYAAGITAMSLDAADAVRDATPEPGMCRRCGVLGTLLDGICGSCADDLRAEQQALLGDQSRMPEESIDSHTDKDFAF